MVLKGLKVGTGTVSDLCSSGHELPFVQNLQASGSCLFVRSAADLWDPVLPGCCAGDKRPAPRARRSKSLDTAYHMLTDTACMCVCFLGHTNKEIIKKCCLLTHTQMQNKKKRTTETGNLISCSAPLNSICLICLIMQAAVGVQTLCASEALIRKERWAKMK